MKIKIKGATLPVLEDVYSYVDIQTKATETEKDGTRLYDFDMDVDTMRNAFDLGREDKHILLEKSGKIFAISYLDFESIVIKGAIYENVE